MNKGIKKIKIHGLLATFFGPVFNVNIQNINNIVDALDCIKNGFRKKIKQLLSDGYNYSVVQDDENKQCIHLIPIISGSGKVGMYIVGAILIIIAVVMFFVPGLQPASAALAMWTIATIFSTGASLIITAATMPKAPQGADPQQQYQSLAGGVSAASDASRSFIFDSNTNIGMQGGSIPIGYGKLKIGSKLLHSNILSFETSQLFLSQSQIDLLNPPFFDYLAN